MGHPDVLDEWKKMRDESAWRETKLISNLDYDCEYFSKFYFETLTVTSERES